MWDVSDRSTGISTALAGDFRLAGPDGRWLSCGAAVIPAGVRHTLDVGRDPLAVFYPEPNVATFADLVRLGALWAATGRILVAQTATLGPFRALYEDRNSLGFAGEMLDDLVQFLGARSGPPLLDPRIARNPMARPQSHGPHGSRRIGETRRSVCLALPPFVQQGDWRAVPPLPHLEPLAGRK